MLLPVGVDGFPCLVVIVDALGNAHMAVVVVEKKMCVCVFIFLGSLSGVRRSSYYTKDSGISSLLAYSISLILRPHKSYTHLGTVRLVLCNHYYYYLK